MVLLNGVRVKPKWLTQGARVMTAGPGRTRQVAVGDLAQQVVVMLGQDQAQVIDAGGRRWCGWLGLRHLAVDVATDDERDGLTDRSTFPEHVQPGQILRIEAQLDAATDE